VEDAQYPTRAPQGKSLAPSTRGGEWDFAKSHREVIETKGHYRRTKKGALAWVNAHDVNRFIQEHGEPDAPEKGSTSIYMGKEAMSKAIEGHDVIHAMHRKNFGWIDFIQGGSAGGIIHIKQRRDAQHKENPKKYPLNGVQTLKLLPPIIASGRIVENYENKVVIEYNGAKIILARVPKKKKDGKKIPAHGWVISGFEES
jgi:hypothetical protein